MLSHSRILKVEGACGQSVIDHAARIRNLYLDGIPILPSERILSSLLETFLAFRKALVPV